MSAPFYDQDVPDTGLIRAYEWTKVNVSPENWKWVQIGQDIYGNNLAGSNVENAWEGEALALSGDGNTLITGSYNVDNERGRARVFRYEEDSNVWVQLGDNFDGEKAWATTNRQMATQIKVVVVPR